MSGGTSVPGDGGAPRLVLLTGLDLRAYRGGEKYAATLARELQARGVRVLLYSKVDPNEPPRLAIGELATTVGVPYRFYRLFWLPRLPPLPLAPLAFVRTLRASDTIFTLESTPRFTALVVVLGRLLGRRVVVGLHDPTQVDRLAAEVRGPPPARWRARLFVRFLRGADAVHTINAAQAATLRAAGARSNVAMVNSFTTAEPRPRRPGRPSTFEALFVGPLEREQKGIDLLVEVARRVLAARPEVRLTIVGAGRDRGLVEALAHDEPDRVRLLGFVAERELADVYASADALWLTSRAESFSLVALEAFTQGVPVVGFALPGLHDVTEIYPEGRVAPFDTEGFARSAETLVDRWRETPAEYATLRERLRREAVARLGARVQVPKLAAMLGLRIEELAVPPEAPRPGVG